MASIGQTLVDAAKQKLMSFGSLNGIPVVKRPLAVAFAEESNGGYVVPVQYMTAIRNIDKEDDERRAKRRKRRKRR